VAGKPSKVGLVTPELQLLDRAAAALAQYRVDDVDEPSHVVCPVDEHVSGAGPVGPISIAADREDVEGQLGRVLPGVPPRA
jgi:hypothetical protein